MGLGPRLVLCAQAMTRTSSAVKLKASFKDKHQYQQVLPTLAQGSSMGLFIIPPTQSQAKQEDG